MSRFIDKTICLVHIDIMYFNSCRFAKSRSVRAFHLANVILRIAFYSLQIAFQEVLTLQLTILYCNSQSKAVSAFDIIVAKCQHLNFC